MDIEAIRKQVEQQVMQYFHLEPTVTDAPMPAWSRAWT